MSTGIGVNHAKRKLTANELVLAMAVSPMRAPNVAMIAAARGSDGIHIDLEHTSYPSKPPPASASPVRPSASRPSRGSRRMAGRMRNSSARSSCHGDWLADAREHRAGGQAGGEVHHMTMMRQDNDLGALAQVGQHMQGRRGAVIIEGLQDIVADER
jgi:hypothetical protein